MNNRTRSRRWSAHPRPPTERLSSPHVKLTQIFRGCVPFLAMVFLAMIILYNFKGVVFWLPDLVYGR